MKLELSTIAFASAFVLDFAALKARGWHHPLGLRDEPLEQSLFKTIGGWRFDIVRHVGRTWDYTEVYVDSVSEGDIRKKGEGRGMDLATALGLIYALYRELEDA